MWSAVDGSGAFLYLSPGEETTAYLSFGKVDTDSVTVMVPMAGFTTVSVLDANDAKKAGINLTTAKQELAKWPNAITKDKDTAPVTIERYTRALDDSTSTHAGGKDITVTLASDVTFASDSADLTPQADTQLKTVSAQLARYPDGGALTARLEGLTRLIGLSGAPALVRAAAVHGEMVTVRPFLVGNAAVGRLLVRHLITRDGLEPTGVAVPDQYAARMPAAYADAAAAYASGTHDGVVAWVVWQAEAIFMGIQEAQVICRTIQAGTTAAG